MDGLYDEWISNQNPYPEQKPGLCQKLIIKNVHVLGHNATVPMRYYNPDSKPRLQLSGPAESHPPQGRQRVGAAHQESTTHSAHAGSQRWAELGQRALPKLSATGLLFFFLSFFKNILY